MKVTWKWFLSLIGSLFILFAGLRCGSHISSTDTAALTAALTAASSITFTVCVVKPRPSGRGYKTP